MLYFFSGTDRDKARAAMNADIERAAKKYKGEVLRVTDANSPEDLRMALRGGGMFGAMRIVVLEGVLESEDMQPIVVDVLSQVSKSKEPVFLYEEKPLADMRRKLEKYAEKSARYDMSGKPKDGGVFALASALAKGDRKMLWVGYQRALSRGERAEAIHGILFWGAKRSALSARRGSPEYHRSATLLAELAELPHKARRAGFELEYALERFLLSLPAR